MSLTQSLIFPAMDLMDGGCVRLRQGHFDQRTNYAVDPAQVLEDYAAAGADWVHIVDLDGAKNGAAEQSHKILNLVAGTNLKVQTGGGLRDLSQIQRLLDGGVERVVIGSLAVTQPQTVKFWLRELGSERIVIALDVKVTEDGTPYPTTHGWKDTAERNLWDTLDDYLGTGLRTILVTDISRDGELAGGNVELYRQIGENYPTLDLITSGGVGSLDDVRALKAINPYGIIIGKALYDGRFTTQQAISC